jgi:murein DD-endopeptidase MepM/ murein hydrolase activator NlpD
MIRLRYILLALLAAPLSLSAQTFAASPDPVYRGNPFTVYGVLPDGEPLPAGLRAVLLSTTGKRLVAAPFFALPAAPVAPHGNGPPIFPTVNACAAILAVPDSAVVPNEGSTGSSFRLKIEAAGKTITTLPLQVLYRSFNQETIPLNRKNTNIRTKITPEMKAQSEELWAILSHFGRRVYSTGPFIAPVSSRRLTSFFGDRRIYRYINGDSAPAVHAGIDFGVPTGTPVQACATGRVVLAKFRIATGWSVILEHAPGLYSIYYHMSRILARTGEIYSQGRVLGYSGATGLATGPHLHWEIRAAGVNANPGILTKEAFLRKIDTKTDLPHKERR